MKLTEKNLELAVAEAIIKLLKNGVERYSSTQRDGIAIWHVLADLHPGIVHHFDSYKDDPSQLQQKMEEMIESVAVFLGKDEIAKAKLARELAKKDHEIKSLRAKIDRAEKEKKVLSS